MPTLPPVTESPHLTGPRHTLDAHSLRMKSQGALHMSPSHVSELGLCSTPLGLSGWGASGRALCCRAFQCCRWRPRGRAWGRGRIRPGQEARVAGAQGRQSPHALCLCLYWLLSPPQGAAGHRVCRLQTAHPGQRDPSYGPGARLVPPQTSGGVSVAPRALPTASLSPRPSEI